MTDRELVRWALDHGWKYFNMNDQLMDQQGAMTTANRWDDIGQYRRGQIEAQMRGSAALPGDSK